MRPLLLAALALPLLGAGTAQHGKHHTAPAKPDRSHKSRVAEDNDSASTAGERLDAHFIADRVLVDVPLARGGRLRFFTDSGGGGPVLTTAAAKRLGLATRNTTAKIEDLDPDTQELRDPLRLKPGAFPKLPIPIFVTKSIAPATWEGADNDGLLGNNWFAGHVWTWDYPNGTLTLEAPEWRAGKRDHVVPIGFRGPRDGKPAYHFPRITIEIAGERVPMLLDTGATTMLTPTAARKIGGPRLRATSMIVASRIAAWRKAHPKWRVIENAQAGTGDRMIEVPDVRIAGIQVGPLWFTERPDRNFRVFMSSAMSGTVDGAIGGNAFHSLRMTVDYPHARAAFRRTG